MIASCASLRGDGELTGFFQGDISAAQTIRFVWVCMTIRFLLSPPRRWASIPASDPIKDERRDFLSAARPSRFCCDNIAGIAA